MKNKIAQLWEKIKENRRILVGLGLTLVAATVYYFAWAIPQTYADSTHIGFEPGRMDNHMWWASDARDYQQTGDFLFGNSETHVLNRRPWLYPFFVGSLRAITPVDPDISLWAVQFMLWLLTTTFIFLAAERATRKIPLAILASALFWTHPSPIALTFHGMSENLNTLLLAIFVYFLFTRYGEENAEYWLIFLFSLLLVTKPTYQLQLGIFLLYLLIKSFGKWRIWKFWGKIVLALLPLWIQFFITWQVVGTPMVSDVAGHTLKYWMVTRVYAKAEALDTPLPEIATAIENWTSEEEIAYLLDHKQATLATYFSNLVQDGLLADSYVIIDKENTMNIAIMTLNKWHLYFHLLMLPLVGYLLLFNTKGKWQVLWIIYLTFLIQTLASGVSADQGDRLIITGLPLWIVSYAFVFPKLGLLSESKE